MYLSSLRGCRAFLVGVSRECISCLIRPSSLCHAISTDIPGPFSPPFSIDHWFQQVFRATYSIDAELLYVVSSCLCSSMWRGPREYVTYEFVPTFLAVSCMSGSSNFESFRDGWLVAVQLCGVLAPRLVQYARSILV